MCVYASHLPADRCSIWRCWQNNMILEQDCFGLVAIKGRVKILISQHNATDVSGFWGVYSWHADCRNVHQLYHKPSGLLIIYGINILAGILVWLQFLQGGTRAYSIEGRLQTLWRGVVWTGGFPDVSPVNRVPVVVLSSCYRQAWATESEQRCTELMSIWMQMDAPPRLVVMMLIHQLSPGAGAAWWYKQLAGDEKNTLILS